LLLLQSVAADVVDAIASNAFIVAITIDLIVILSRFASYSYYCSC
jgi:hypothetical protein